MKLELLDQPFKAEDIEWRAQQCGKNAKGIWIRCLAYVTNRAIMNRLDEVCGKGNWKNEFKDHGKVVECGISILIDGEWVTKWDASEETNIEAVKGGRSGAMKRAAVQWGIGRYLYDLEEGWGIVDAKGQYGGKIQAKGNQQAEFFKWNPPALPAWALPNGATQAPATPANHTSEPVDTLASGQQIENISLLDVQLKEKGIANDINKGALYVSKNRTDQIGQLTSVEAGTLINILTTKLTK